MLRYILTETFLPPYDYIFSNIRASNVLTKCSLISIHTLSIFHILKYAGRKQISFYFACTTFIGFLLIFLLHRLYHLPSLLESLLHIMVYKHSCFRLHSFFSIPTIAPFILFSFFSSFLSYSLSSISNSSKRAPSTSTD